MPALQDLIQQFAHGEIDAEAVSARIRKSDPTRPAGDLTFQERMLRYVEDDNDYADTWSEVVAANMLGIITATQLAELRETFVPEGATSGEEDEAAELGEFDIEPPGDPDYVRLPVHDSGRENAGGKA